MGNGLLRTKPLEKLKAETEREGRRLKKVLGPLELTAIGIGCIIGVGIFVLPGVEAAHHSGPGIVLSFAIAALACACSALCYAELAAMIPVSGSAYTYGYACLGEILAWVIGWDLILEYMVGASLVAIGWSAYLQNLLKGMGLALPDALASAPVWSRLAHPGQGPFTLGMDLPAALIVLAISYLLYRGIRESSRVNLTVVVVKIAVILVFIALAVGHVRPTLWHPFLPFGFKGVMTSAAIVFLAYIGFDAVSTTAEEARNPQRDMPIGILASLTIATVLYMAVAAIMTGVVPYDRLGVADPVALVLDTLNMPWASALVSVGALAGITSVLLVLLMGQPRILFAMSRDGLLPAALSSVHPRFQTPFLATWITGLVVAVSAALTPISVVAELCSIGTLFAFVIVCGGVLVLRWTRPQEPRPFRAPWVPVLPLAGIALCLYLMASLPAITWLRFFVWLCLGILVYGFYGYRNSALNGFART